MKTDLLITIGNRDVQLKKNASVPLAHQQWFTRNNDSEEYRINTTHQEKSFYEITRELLENHYEQYENCFSFPMIQKTLDYAQAKPDTVKIIFSTSSQNPPDRQDCVYAAQIAQKYFSERGYQCFCRFFECSPIDFASLVNHYIDLFRELPDGSYISTSGGTPDMRAATYFAGMFKNFQFVTINARSGKVSSASFKKQEQIVLKEIIQKMLSVYDYEGIRSLPVSDEIKELCTEAINNYNCVKGIAEGNYLQRSCQAINLLIENTNVCYKQGRYAETIGRIFRIEEAVWHMLLYNYLKEQKLLDEKENVKRVPSDGKKKKLKFEKLIESADARKSFLKSQFGGLFEEKEGTLWFKKYPDVHINSGKNFYWYFFKTQEKFESFTSFFEKINKNKNDEAYKGDSLLNKTRNKSYLGHGFEGVSEEDVTKICGNFAEFLKSLRQTLKEIELPENKVFDDTNQKILSLLQ